MSQGPGQESAVGAIVKGEFDPKAPREREFLIDKRGRAYERTSDGSIRRVTDPIEEQRIVAKFKEQDLAANMVAAIAAPGPKVEG